MTMLDDNVLADLLAEAATAFDAPEGGPAAILERAMGSATDNDDDADFDADVLPDELSEPRLRRAARVLRDHRILSVAAALVVVAAVVGGLTLQGSSTPATTALRAGVATTVPALHAAASAPPASTGTGGTTGAGTSTGSPASGNFGVANGGSTTAGTATSPPLPAGTPAPSVTAPSSAAQSLPSNVGQPARIEQTGSLSLTVGKGALAKTMSELGFLASAYNGFVQNSQTQSGAISATGAPSGSITLQVPVDSFTNVLKKVQSLGKTDALSTKATDVTGQYVDLQARISALQDSLQQYETILTKANTIGDVLSVQTQIDSIQSQIEQEQGQLQLLTSETTYSTLTVMVSEGLPPVHHQPPPHHSGLSAAWHDSVHGFVDGVEGLIRIGGPVLFALLCALVLIVVGRVVWRRIQRHNL